MTGRAEAPPPSGSETREPSIRVIMMPKDTNALGTIFGGVILSYIDQAGAVEAHRTVPGRIVTVSMHEVDDGNGARGRALDRSFLGPHRSGCCAEGRSTWSRHDKESSSEAAGR